MENMKDKTKGLAIVFFVVLVILAIGWVSFNTFTNSISGPTTSAEMNATTSAGNTVFNIGGIILVIASIFVIISVVYYRVSTPERYKKFSKIIAFFDVSTYYFGWGLVSFVAVAIPGYLIWLLYQYSVVEGNTGSLIEVVKWILVIVCIYFGLSGFGYLTKTRIADNWRKRREETEYKNNLDNIPGVME